MIHREFADKVDSIIDNALLGEIQNRENQLKEVVKDNEELKKRIVNIEKEYIEAENNKLSCCNNNFKDVIKQRLKYIIILENFVRQMLVNERRQAVAAFYLGYMGFRLLIS